MGLPIKTASTRRRSFGRDSNTWPRDPFFDPRFIQGEKGGRRPNRTGNPRHWQPRLGDRHERVEVLTGSSRALCLAASAGITQWVRIELPSVP